LPGNSCQMPVGSYTYSCVACGGTGQACCSGNTCASSALVCQTTAGSFNYSCVACGGKLGPCCAGNTCATGACRASGTCP
jgi:hypothetical protein